MMPCTAFCTSKTPILTGETHGKDWMNKVKETMIRGGLNKCAMELVSPIPYNTMPIQNQSQNVRRKFKRCKIKAHPEETATFAGQRNTKD